MAEKKLYKETVVAGKEFKTQPPSQKMYRGISTVNEANSSFALYDIGLIKQDLLNHFHIRQGEKLENPEFGTNIYAYIFDPLDQDTKNLIIQEIEDVVNYDPRVQLDQVEVDEFEHGVQVRISLLYIGYGIGEKLDLLFDNEQGLLTGPSSFYPANTTN